ncbi:HNH endonuclease signature motif containing protein [Nocardia australiensis]|uniref:HNH endonuclease signature motif containing protein n=1 Tax=Nocardia australiensis TaxID=2887191 RepID=UPI001D13CBF7|nr:HNH endonuclease signature motif containing protein [Nocardia australiensis]
MPSINATIADPSVEAALCTLEAGLSQVMKVGTGRLSNRDRLRVLQRVEVVIRALPGLGSGLIAQIDTEWSNDDFATRNVSDTLTEGLRISPAEARARCRSARELAHRNMFDGEVLEPELPATAAAQCDGVIGPAHVQVIQEFFRHLPACVDTPTRTRAEVELAGHARVLRPDQLRKVAQRVEAFINPDGVFDDTDRARRRSFTMGRQGPDLMSKCTLIADPELRAYLDACFAKLAEPGACNPDENVPARMGGSSEREAAEPGSAELDDRSGGQRQHDALKAIMRAMLASGELGQHRGLPVTVIATTTVQELEEAVEQTDSGRMVVSGSPVVTGGGNLLPMHDLIRMAAHAHHYLAIFDDADGRPLYLGRSKRIASRDQRIMLHARDIGCTHPGCGKPGYLCETHHVDEWANGGGTNADQLTFACEPHHRMVGHNDNQWGTLAAPAGHPTPGRTQWIPPTISDPNRTPRTNHFHHPNEYLAAPSSFTRTTTTHYGYRGKRYARQHHSPDISPTRARNAPEIPDKPLQSSD